MAALGFSPRRAVTIEIVEELPTHTGAAIGLYDRRTDRVAVIARERYLAGGAQDGGFVPRTEETYISYVAHEVAHALALDEFTIPDPSIASQEYVAAVVQIGVLEPATRDAVLQNFGGEGFRKPSEISLLAYQLDPAGFMVNCYRHFLRPENGPGFVGALLSGRIRLRDRVPYGF